MLLFELRSYSLTYQNNYRMLDMLEDFLEHRTIPYARLDGSTHRPRRTLDIKLVRCRSLSNHTDPHLSNPSQFQQERSRGYIF